MYRRYTTTGTNNGSSAIRKGLPVFSGLVLMLLIRCWFLLAGQMTALDDYGYYQASMIRTGDMRPVLTSGAALAYSGSLSAILRFTGNRMDVTVYYHILLQAFSFCFLYSGYRSFFGRTASFLQIPLFSFLPWLTVSVFKISPENLYLFAWSLAAMLLGLVNGGCEKKRGIIMPAIAGGALGLACGLHGMGFWLFPLLLFAAGGSWGKLAGMLFGTVSGILLSLAGYQKIMECGFKETVIWWGRGVLGYENGRWQDMELWLPVWLFSSLAAGVFLKAAESLLSRRRSRRAGERVERDPIIKDGDGKKETEKMETKPEDGKKINYIENPLPLPKKHVKRIMEFKLDEKDDFDIEIDEKDDFDI